METEKASLILGNNWSDCLQSLRKILNPAKHISLISQLNVKVK